MNTFEITVSLNNNNKATIFNVVPNDNHENSYPTYFQLLTNGEIYAEIRLNDELEWEICKGNELSPEDIQVIMNEIGSHVYKQPAVAGPIDDQAKQTEKPHADNWFDKIVNSLSTKKSAA